MTLTCLTLSNIRYLSRVKCSNPRKGVAPSYTLWCSSYWKKGALWSPSTTVASNLLKCFVLSKVDDLSRGWPNSSFWIATTRRCRGGGHSFPWIAPLYLWSLPYNAVLSKVVSSTILWVFGMTRPRIKPHSPAPLASTLLKIVLHLWTCG